MDHTRLLNKVERKLSEPFIDRRGREWTGREVVVGSSLRGSHFMGLQALDPGFVAGSFSFYDPAEVEPTHPNVHYFRALEERTGIRGCARGYGDPRGSDESKRKYEARLFREREFRHEIAECLDSSVVRGKAPVVLAYEPVLELESIINASRVAKYFGISWAEYRYLSSKPRIEEALDDHEIDVPVIPWNHVRKIEFVDGLHEVHDGRIIVRGDGGASGKGILSIRGDEIYDPRVRQDIQEMLDSGMATVSVARLIENAVSLNASGVVFRPTRNGKVAPVSRFPVSAQIIGPPALSELPFGYCGNDFAYGLDLPDEVLQQCDDILVKVGEYLGRQGFVGAFGVDFLLTETGQVFFTEVNVRFQGSTRLLSEIANSAGESDVVLEHLAAWLGIPFGGTLTAVEWKNSGMVPLSQMYLHNTSGQDMVVKDTLSYGILTGERVKNEMRPPSGYVVKNGAVMERIVDGQPFLNSDARWRNPQAHGRELNQHALGLVALAHTAYEMQGMDKRLERELSSVALAR